MGDQVEAAIAAAMSKLGAPYVWATAGPETFDCSGFTWWIASQVLGPQDYELRSSHHQFNVWGDGRDGETARRPDGS
jgi:cell wall-associated NlpC family hydrolase